MQLKIAIDDCDTGLKHHSELFFNNHAIDEMNKKTYNIIMVQLYVGGG